MSSPADSADLGTRVARVIVLACFLGLGLAALSVMVESQVPRHLREDDPKIVMMKAGGWPFAFLEDTWGTGGGHLSLLADDVFTLGWFLLDAAILSALSAVAPGAIAFHRRRT